MRTVDNTVLLNVQHQDCLVHRYIGEEVDRILARVEKIEIWPGTYNMSPGTHAIVSQRVWDETL